MFKSKINKYDPESIVKYIEERYKNDDTVKKLASSMLYCSLRNDSYRSLCNNKLCPHCHAIKKKVKLAKSLSGIRKFIEQNKTQKYITITIYIGDCEFVALEEGIESLHKTWKFLINKTSIKKKLKNFGSIMITEISKSCHEDMFRPHLHGVICVQSSYFGKNRITDEEWNEAFIKSADKVMKLRYRDWPMYGEFGIYVKPIKNDNIENIKRFLGYAMEYPVDIIQSDSLINRYYRDTYKVHMYSSSGEIKKCISQATKEWKEYSKIKAEQERNDYLESREHAYAMEKWEQDLELIELEMDG